MSHYSVDLAFIHDVGFGDFARQSAPGLLKLLQKNGIRDGLVIDLGCGSGIWARELTNVGFEVLGIDISRAMTKLARKRAPYASFKTGSFVKVSLPKCVAVTSLGECLNYQFDRTNSRAQLKTIFRRVYDALRPGGVFIFDLAEPGRVGSKQLKNWWQGKDWAILVEASEEKARKILTRRISTFRKVKSHYRRSDEVHRLLLYERSDVASQLRGVGFRVDTLNGYGRMKFPKSHVGFLAQK